MIGLDRMMAHIPKFIIMGASCLLLFSSSASAYHAGFDSTFSVDGKDVIITSGPAVSADKAYGSVVMPDGSYVVCGTRATGSSYESVIRRYNANGTLDTNFGTGGVLAQDFSDINAENTYYDITAMSDGSFVAVGFASMNDGVGGAEQNAIIAKITADGVFDTSFGGGGIVAFTGLGGGPSNDVFRAVSVDSSDGIYVAGDGGQDAAIAKFQTNGNLDTTFSLDGLEMIPASPGIEDLRDIAIDSEGKIVVVGTSANSGGDATIRRFNSNGTLDTDFGVAGEIIMDGVLGEALASDIATAVKIDGDNIYLIGHSATSTGNALFMQKLNSSGLNIWTSTTEDGDRPHDVDFFEGNIYVVGADKHDGDAREDIVVWRFDDDGGLDGAFSVDGKLTFPGIASMANESAVASSVEVKAGNIYFAGIAENAVSSATAWVAGRIDYGGEIINQPSGAIITDIDDNVTSGPFSGLNNVIIKSSTGIPITQLSYDFEDSDLDLAGVTLSSSISDGRAVIAGLSGAHSLYVPKIAGHTSVLICPNATNLAQVALGCGGQLVYTIGSSNVSVVRVAGQDYWKIDGLSGTGGLSMGIAAPSTGMNEASLSRSFVFLAIGTPIVGMSLVRIRSTKPWSQLER